MNDSRSIMSQSLVDVGLRHVDTVIAPAIVSSLLCNRSALGDSYSAAVGH